MFYIKLDRFQYRFILKPLLRSRVLSSLPKKKKSFFDVMDKNGFTEYGIFEINEKAENFHLMFFQYALGREFNKLGTEEYVLDMCPDIDPINIDKIPKSVYQQIVEIEDYYHRSYENVITAINTYDGEKLEVQAIVNDIIVDRRQVTI